MVRWRTVCIDFFFRKKRSRVVVLGEWCTHMLSCTFFLPQMLNKVESRYVMEPSSNKSGGSGLEWWSAESELSIWPSARQLERKFLNVVCRAVVINETVYQRVTSSNVTSTAALTVQQVHKSRASSVSAGTSSPSGQQHQVSASMASSQHSRDSYSFSAANKSIV